MSFPWKQPRVNDSRNASRFSTALRESLTPGYFLHETLSSLPYPLSPGVAGGFRPYWCLDAFQE